MIKQAFTLKALLHGLIVALLSSALSSLAAIFQNGALPTMHQLQVIGITSIAAGIGYVLKNIIAGSSTPTPTFPTA